MGSGVSVQIPQTKAIQSFLCLSSAAPKPTRMDRTCCSSSDNVCCVFSCVWLMATPWTVAQQAPLSIEFSWQEYWSRLLFPSPGDLPNSGIEPESLVSPALAGGFFTTGAIWEIVVPHKLTRAWILIDEHNHALGFCSQGVRDCFQVAGGEQDLEDARKRENCQQRRSWGIIDKIKNSGKD